MEFRILGPLEAEVGGQLLPLRGRRQRSLLALLVLSANEVVPDDRLLEDLWGDEPPASGRAALRVRISQLRKALGEAGAALLTRPPGYVLHVEPDRIDARLFERLAGGRAARRGVHRPGRHDAARGARPLARPGARGRRVRVVRTGRDRPPGGAPADGNRGPHRRRPRAGPARGGGRRARGAGRVRAAAGAPPRPAHARPHPGRPTRSPPPTPAGPRRRARTSERASPLEARSAQDTALGPPAQSARVAPARQPSWPRSARSSPDAADLRRTRVRCRIRGPERTGPCERFRETMQAEIDEPADICRPGATRSRCFGAPGGAGGPCERAQRRAVHAPAGRRSVSRAAGARPGVETGEVAVGGRWTEDCCSLASPRGWRPGRPWSLAPSSRRTRRPPRSARAGPSLRRRQPPCRALIRELAM
jgi:hypothetical protein